jgi:ubiquitin carboxyl-terminal hydrolase 8
MCNVPENLCAIGMTESKVKTNLPNESKVFWEMRKSRPIIVFVDWSSVSFSRNSPIWHLREILVEWDQDIESDKKPEMILLEGGYERWLMTYPMKCSNPHVRVPKENAINAPSMDGIEYPNLEDIIMKDTSKSTPMIDRSTKSNAVKNYEANLSQSELLERKELLMNKSMQNDRELLQLENVYTNLISNKENEEDQSNSQNVLYKILELQTKQKDNDIEKETINEVIKNAPVKPSELSKVEDIENRLKQKENEMNKTHQELEMKQRQRSEALKKARENKPNFENKTPIKAPRRNELILSPRNLNSQNSIPHFDRASKPMTVSNQNHYDNQDFAPVSGRVVK